MPHSFDLRCSSWALMTMVHLRTLPPGVSGKVAAMTDVVTPIRLPRI